MMDWAVRRRPLVSVFLLAAALGCGPSHPHSTASGRQRAPGTPEPVGEQEATAAGAPEPPAEPPAEQSGENALYLGFALGPIVRVGEDGRTTELGDGGTSALVSAPDGSVYAIMSGRAFVLGEDGAEPIGDEGPTDLRAIAPGAADDVWAASQHRVAHFDGSTWSAVSDELFAEQQIQDLAFDAEGALWVMTPSRLFRHIGGSFAEIAPMAGSTRLHAFVREAEGRLSVVHSRGIDRYDGQAWSMVPVDWVERSRDGRMTSTSLFDAAYGGGVWAFANSRHEICLKVPEVQYFGESSLLVPATRVNDVSVDQQGRPWFATNGGLLLLKRYGSPRTEQWWPTHGFEALRRAPTQVLAVGRGPSVLPEVAEPVGSVVRGNLGRRQAGAEVLICGGPRADHGGVACGSGASGVADARGRFEIGGVYPGGYVVLVRSGGALLQSYRSCCAPSRPGAPVELGDLSILGPYDPRP